MDKIMENLLEIKLNSSQFSKLYEIIENTILEEGLVTRIRKEEISDFDPGFYIN